MRVVGVPFEVIFIFWGFMVFSLPKDCSFKLEDLDLIDVFWRLLWRFEARHGQSKFNFNQVPIQ
jgi:hypothetical protein